MKFLEQFMIPIAILGVMSTCCTVGLLAVACVASVACQCIVDVAVVLGIVTLPCKFSSTVTPPAIATDHGRNMSCAASFDRPIKNPPCRALEAVKSLRKNSHGKYILCGSKALP